MKTRIILISVCSLLAIVGVFGVKALYAGTHGMSVPVTIDKPVATCGLVPCAPGKKPDRDDPYAMVMPRYFLQVMDDFDGINEEYGLAFAPDMDIVQTDNEYLVQLDIPGMKKDEIAVEINRDILTVSGHRKDTWKEENKENGEYVYRTGQRYGEFSRSIQLPEDANAESVKATYENGVLEIRLGHTPQKTEAVKKVDIQ
jgi:HSP20 family protein